MLTRKSLFVTFVCCLCVVGFMSCGGSSSSSDSPDSSTTTDSTGAAVAALFGTGESASINKPFTIPQKLANLFVSMAIAQAEGAGERDTCDDPDEDGLSDGPQEITAPLTGDAGTYGNTSGTSMTLAEDDFCQNSEGTENTGDGPDGNGLFAAFTLTSEVTGTCTSGDSEETITMESGEGVWRNTETSFPEVYGTFVIDGTTVNCSIFMNEDQTVQDTSSCSSEDGTALTLDSDVECQLNASGDGGEDTEDV